MLTLRKLLLLCFANAAILFFACSITAVPFFFKMQGYYKSAAPAYPTPSLTLAQSILLMAGDFIVLSPVLITLVNGMAWWTLKAGKPSGRFWALTASLTFLLISGLLIYTDHLIASKGQDFHPPMLDAIIAVQTIVGLVGLIAFGPGTPSVSSGARAQPPRIAGDGTHRYLDAIGIILQVGGTIWLMDICLRWGYDQGLPLTHGLEAWIQWFLVIGIAVLLHESAHALAGMALGMKLRAFLIGPFQFRVCEGRWKFEFHPTQLLAFSGAAGLASVDPDESRWNEVAVIAAGPWVNLLTGGVAAALAYSAANVVWWSLWEYFALYATVSLVAGVVNLLPLRPEGLYSDGARILQIFRGGPLYDYQRAVRTAQASSVSRVRPRDYDIAAIDRASLHFTTGEIGLLLQLWASEHYLDLGEVPEARGAFAKAEQIYNESAAEIQAGLHSCLVIGAAITRCDAAATRDWWQKMQNKKVENQDVNYWLAKCAFLWSVDDLGAAREAWSAGMQKLGTLPDVGGCNYDRDCYARMKEILDKGPNRAVPKHATSLPMGRLRRHFSLHLWPNRISQGPAAQAQCS
jgi:hypothetical protein